MNNTKKQQRQNDANCEQPIPFTFAEHFPTSNANERQLPIATAVSPSISQNTGQRQAEREPDKQFNQSASKLVPIAPTQPKPLRKRTEPRELEALVAEYQAADLVTKIAMIEKETRSDVLMAYYEPMIVIALALARNKYCSPELFITLYALKKPKVTAVLMQNHRYQQLRHSK